LFPQCSIPDYCVECHRPNARVSRIKSSLARDGCEVQSSLLLSAMTTPATEPNPPPAPPESRRRPLVVRRLVWLAMVGLIAIAGAAGYRYFWYARPVGAGPAGRAVSADRFNDE